MTPPEDVAGWLGRVLIGLDRLLNAVTLGTSSETISGRLGRSGSWWGRLLSIFQRDHALRAVEYTPWGTVDPHGLPAIDPAIAADWGAAIAVIFGPDLDHFPSATKDAAQRALVRLAEWMARPGARERWAARMQQEMEGAGALATSYSRAQFVAAPYDPLKTKVAAIQNHERRIA